jgi:hypothetical protein
MDVDRLAELQQAHHRQLLAIRAAAATITGRLWDQLANVDDTAAARWVEAVTPIIAATRDQTATLAAGYIGALDVAADAPPIRTLPPITPIRNGLGIDETYLRPIITARRMLGDGNTWDDAMSAGRARAISTAETDVMLVNRQAIVDIGDTRRNITGYRRVLTGRSCTLCAIASTQRYRRGQLAPIHNNCDCDVAPIYGDADPGRIVNRDLYNELKRSGASDELSLQQGASRARQRASENRDRANAARAELAREQDPDRRRRLTERANRYDQRAADADQLASTRQAQLREFRQQRGGSMRTVEVREHGELGPVLTQRSHNFSGPGDLG